LLLSMTPYSLTNRSIFFLDVTLAYPASSSHVCKFLLASLKILTF
jgi:hypothetical protein